MNYSRFCTLLYQYKKTGLLPLCFSVCLNLDSTHHFVIRAPNPVGPEWHKQDGSKIGREGKENSKCPLGKSLSQRYPKVQMIFPTLSHPPLPDIFSPLPLIAYSFAITHLGKCSLLPPHPFCYTHINCRSITNFPCSRVCLFLICKKTR